MTICNEREVPLDEFETALLTELLAAQAELVATTPDSGEPSNIIPIGGRHRPAGVAAATGRHRRAGRLLAVGAAAAVAASVALVSVAHRSWAPVGASPAAAAVLDSASRATVSTPLVGTGATEYRYTKAQVTEVRTLTCPPGRCGVPASESLAGQLDHRSSNDSFSYYLPGVEETWVSESGSGRLHITYGQARFLSAHDAQVWQESGTPFPQHDPIDTAISAGQLPVGPNNLTATADLPTDAIALQAAIVERFEGGHPDPAATFSFASDLLARSDASPALRGALYQVLASTPGVQLAGNVKDPLGQTGNAVVIIGHSIGYELVIDVTTGMILEERQVSTAQQGVVPSTTVIFDRVVVASAPVPSTSQTSSAG
jgi:hypothetical protein